MMAFDRAFQKWELPALGRHAVVTRLTTDGRSGRVVEIGFP